MVSGTRIDSFCMRDYRLTEEGEEGEEGVDILMGTLIVKQLLIIFEVIQEQI